jgi:hypothetical protein
MPMAVPFDRLDRIGISGRSRLPQIPVGRFAYHDQYLAGGAIM